MALEAVQDTQAENRLNDGFFTRMLDLLELIKPDLGIYPEEVSSNQS